MPQRRLAWSPSPPWKRVRPAPGAAAEPRAPDVLSIGDGSRSPLPSQGEGHLRPIRVIREGSAASLLVLLVSVDLVFIGLHVLWDATSLVGNPMYSLEKDRGYPEMYQYIKELWAVLLFGQLFLKTREGGYAAWAFLFGYLLADDALFIHERVGVALAERTGAVPLLGLEPKDFGELAFVAAVMGLLLGSVGLFHWRGSPAFRRATGDLVLILALVAFFGVAVDMLHSALLERGVGLVLEVLEDGGEMVGISLVTGYAFALSTRAPAG